ncbi:MAG: hypothetical protein R3E50_07475 [Halioglobus sp.]
MACITVRFAIRRRANTLGKFLPLGAVFTRFLFTLGIHAPINRLGYFRRQIDLLDAPTSILHPARPSPRHDTEIGSERLHQLVTLT